METQDFRLNRSAIRRSIAPVALALAGVGAAWGDCGVPGSGNCVMPHENVGCADSTCCTTVCNLDPFCCDVGWDEYCAGEAVELCGLRGPMIEVMSFGVSTTLPGGVAVSRWDLAAYHTGTGTWSVYFDGDDVGFAGKTIRAATRTADGDLLIATEVAGTVAGLVGGPSGTSFEAYDILRFTPSTLGDTTAGTWNFHFDGSDVGLTGNTALAIRAVGTLSDGSILINTLGNATLPGGVVATANDLVKFTPTSLGSVTAGTWSMYFDGSDVGLSTSNELLDSAAPRADGSITLSTRGVFSVPGLTGNRGTLFRFIPTSLGDTTAGTYETVLTSVELGINPADVNPLGGAEIMIEYPDGPRPGSGGGGGGGSVPTTCGGAGTGDCCVTSLTPHCSDAECCEAVCAIDPICCSTAWDEYCVAAATNLCIPCMPTARPVMTFGGIVTLPGDLVVSPCDLAAYDVDSNTWSTWFDGNDVGLTSRTIRAATVLPNGDVLVAMGSSGTLAGMTGGPNGTAYEQFDILRFTPTSLGDTTAGSWTFHFDGSDVGLTGSADFAIRSLSALPDGSLVINTAGNVTLPGVGAITANDLVRFTATSLGATTAGTWSMYMDGSSIGLTTTDERLDAAFVTLEGTVMLSTRGVFSVTDLSGSRRDLFDFVPTSTGVNTAGSFTMRLTGDQMGLVATLNPIAAFLYIPTVDIGNRPLLPVLFDRLPSGLVSDAAVEDGHSDYIIVYQGVDPNAASTGLINAQLVIDAIRQEHGDNPSGYGVLDFENPFIDRLEAGPSDPNWAMTVDTVVDLLQAVKAEFPGVKWTMYSMPLIRYWLPPYYSWADAPTAVREEIFTAALIGFDPVLRECDWLNPTAYDRYELATYSSAQQANKTAQEVAYREAAVEVCNRFNEMSGLPRKPILPMISPMFWKVGQISYNMKMIPIEEILRDAVRPIINEGGDGVAVWTGLSYWVRAATSTQELGSGQADARYAFTQDFLGGVAPADWTLQSVYDDLAHRISEHVSTRLDEIRLEIYGLKFGESSP